MYLYRDVSIPKKLMFVILYTSILGLSLTCIGFAVYERANFRKAMTSELSALAETLGANTRSIIGL